MGSIGKQSGAAYLAQDTGIEMGLFKKFDGSLAHDDAGVIDISLAEKLSIDLSFLRGEAEADS